MGLATKKRSLPFAVNKKRSSSTWISFAEFEAQYLIKLEKSDEQEDKTENSPQKASKLSATRRAWNLMSHFPRATTAGTETCKSQIRMKFDPTRLDRMPEVEFGIVQRLASGMESRLADPRGTYHVSKRLSFSEGSCGIPTIPAGISMSSIRLNADVSSNYHSRENPFHHRTSSETIPHSFNSGSIFAPSSSAQFSCPSFTQSDILNAVQRVCSDEPTISSTNLSSVDMKRSYTESPKVIPVISPESSSQDFASQHLSSLRSSRNRSQASNSESFTESTSKKELMHKLERESSASSEETLTEQGTSQIHNGTGSVEEKVPSLRNDITNSIPKVEKSEEQKMAERILRQKKLRARKKAYNITTSANNVSFEPASA